MVHAALIMVHSCMTPAIVIRDGLFQFREQHLRHGKGHIVTFCSFTLLLWFMVHCFFMRVRACALATHPNFPRPAAWRQLLPL